MLDDVEPLPSFNVSALMREMRLAMLDVIRW